MRPTQQKHMERMKLLVLSERPTCDVDVRRLENRPFLFAMVDNHSIVGTEKYLCLNQTMQDRLHAALDNLENNTTVLFSNAVDTAVFSVDSGDVEFASREGEDVHRLRFSVCPIRTRHTRQTAYIIPTDKAVRARWRQSLIDTFKKESYCTEYAMWRSTELDENGVPLLELGDPVLPTDVHAGWESWSLSTIIEELILKKGHLSKSLSNMTTGIGT